MRAPRVRVEVVRDALPKLVLAGLARLSLDYRLRVSAEQGGDVGPTVQPGDPLELLADAGELTAGSARVPRAAQVQESPPGDGWINALCPGPHESQLRSAKRTWIQGASDDLSNGLATWLPALGRLPLPSKG